MATGITKNKWEDQTSIISDEFFDTSTEYEISYKGKMPEEKLIVDTPKENYKPIFTNSSDNELYYGDNLDVLKHLIHKANLKGKIKLIYIDPPYGTNSIFYSRNQKSSYKDDLIGSHFIEFLRRRLILLRELLSEQGSIYLHLDNNMIFESKLILDEVFGAKNFRGIITRKKCSNKNYTKNTYGNISDYIVFYSKSENYTWHRATLPWSEEKMKKEYPCIDEKTGRRYKKVPIHAPGIRNGATGKPWRGKMPPKGKHWQYTPNRLDQLDANGDIYWSATGNPRRKVYFDIDKGIPVQDIWLDVQDSVNQNIKITGYPTEKNPFLIERIINASSNEGDFVLDCFSGSGTTLDVANQLNRKWIGVDNSSEAIKNIFKRFFLGLEEMGDFVNKKVKKKKDLADQMTLFKTQAKYNPKASKTESFSFYSDKRYIQEATEVYEVFKTQNKKLP
jgi:adenine-specific DNA-methyltransferase